MILRTRYGNAEVRSEFGSSAIPLPAQNTLAYSGRPVTPDEAIGLPAVGAAIRSVSEIIGSLPMIVYQRDREQRDRAVSSPQYQLLHDAPNADQSPFDFFSDITASIETTGNAIVQKIKDTRGRVVELIVIDPDYVQIRRRRAEGYRRQPRKRRTRQGTHRRRRYPYPRLHAQRRTRRTLPDSVSPQRPR